MLIGLGGFVGSVLRHLVSSGAQLLARSLSFPYGTLTVNLIGSFFIGALVYLSENKGFFTDSSRAFLFVGVLGGFTTFSAFSNETFNLFRIGKVALAFLNITGQVMLCLGSVWLGRICAQWAWR